MSSNSFKMIFHNTNSKEDCVFQIDESEYTDYINAVISSKYSKPLDGYNRLSYVEIKEDNTKSIIAFCIDYKPSENEILLDIYIALIETSIQRKGYGTMLFEIMLKYIGERVIASIEQKTILKSIRGELSNKDKRLGNWKSSIVFYEKIAKFLGEPFNIRFIDDRNNIVDSKQFEKEAQYGFFMIEQ